MNTLSRRRFLTLGAAAALPSLAQSAPDGIPLIDYHAHLNREVTLDKAVEISQKRGYKFGILEHAGTKANRYPALLSNDDDLKAWLARLEGKPVFKGIQAEWTDWMGCFSKAMVAKLDYVLSDALTMPDKQGNPVRLWNPDVRVDDAQDFMDRYADFHVQIMAKEPLDIIANPTFLPAAIEKDYERLWTEKRMRTVIDAAVRYGVAIEINSRYKLPGRKFLEMAKSARAKFSFGSNLQTAAEIGNIDWSIETARQLGLKADDFFRPARPGRKPIERRKLT